MKYEQWSENRVVTPKEAWDAAINEAARICTHRFLGGGSPGGGISDLDDLDWNTQRMCAEAVLKLK